jgi:hypothetical protein
MEPYKSRKEALKSWDSLVADYLKANPKLKNEKAEPCAICNKVPVPKANKNRKGLWQCYCADEDNHKENKDGICACGHRDHMHGLFGVYDADSKAQSIRRWNEIILRWKNRHNESANSHG